jgi:hypothetical protein
MTKKAAGSMRAEAHDELGLLLFGLFVGKIIRIANQKVGASWAGAILNAGKRR